MHFSTIAASFLAQSLPVAALGGDGTSWRRKRERAVIKKKKYLADLTSLSQPSDARNSKLGVVLVKSPEAPRPTKATSSSNVAFIEQEERQECVPLSGEPDTGLISCGAESRCVASKESSLGGFCVAFKKAQALHRATQENEGCRSHPGEVFTDGLKTCDCTDFSGVGSYTCQFGEEYCLDPAGKVCHTLSTDVTVTPQSVSVTYCYNFGVGATVEEFCYGLYEGAFGTVCEFTANDVACTSCSTTSCESDTGYVIDCFNTELKVSGSTCEEGFLENALIAANREETTMPTTAPVTVSNFSQIPSSEMSQMPSSEMSPMPSSDMADRPTMQPVVMASAASALKEKLTTTVLVVAAAWGLALA